MNRTGRILLVLLLAGLLSVTVSGGEEPEDSAHWKALAERLAAQLEGTAAPINLGRTGLAAVSASSVNGGRPLTNRYYGVLNLFDDGRNWMNNINYTYWLSGGDLQPWVEVRFDAAVTVTSIFVEGRPSFTTQLFMAKGGQFSHAAVQENLKLRTPLPGVSRLRLTFTPREDGENIKVFEVRVMGYPPEGADATPCRPRTAMSRAEAIAVARERLESWKRHLLQPVAERVREVGDDTWEVVFRGRNFDLLRVVVSGQLGARAEPLAQLLPTAEPSGVQAPESGKSAPSQD
jgi:hypothetical protein